MKSRRRRDSGRKRRKRTGWLHSSRRPSRPPPCRVWGELQRGRSPHSHRGADTPGEEELPFGRRPLPLTPPHLSRHDHPSTPHLSPSRPMLRCPLGPHQLHFDFGGAGVGGDVGRVRNRLSSPTIHARLPPPFVQHVVVFLCSLPSRRGSPAMRSEEQEMFLFLRR